MLQFASIAALLAAASATGYTTNYGGLRVARLGGSRAIINNYGLAGRALVGNYGVAVPAGLVGVNSGLIGVNTGLVGGYSYGAVANAPLAVQTVHQVQYADVPSGGTINPISVEIDANPIPINMLFRSASSQLNVQQAHQGAAGSVQESASEDETHILRHSVVKPVLQQIREVVTPFRRITQEIQPVREEINTIVARGVNKAVVAAPVAVQAVQAVAAPVAVQAVAAPVAVQTVAAPIGIARRGVVGVARIDAAPVAIAADNIAATETVALDGAAVDGAVVASDAY